MNCPRLGQRGKRVADFHGRWQGRTAGQRGCGACACLRQTRTAWQSPHGNSGNGVYGQSYVQTPEQIVAALFRDERGPRPKDRPQPQFKHVTARFTTMREDPTEKSGNPTARSKPFFGRGANCRAPSFGAETAAAPDVAGNAKSCGRHSLASQGRNAYSAYCCHGCPTVLAAEWASRIIRLDVHFSQSPRRGGKTMCMIQRPTAGAGVAAGGDGMEVRILAARAGEEVLSREFPQAT